VLLEFPTGFRLARVHEFPFDLAASMKNTIFGRSLRTELTPEALARFSKVDDVAHPLHSTVPGL
jgi:hypothetical protein